MLGLFLPTFVFILSIVLHHMKMHELKALAGPYFLFGSRLQSFFLRLEERGEYLMVKVAMLV